MKTPFLKELHAAAPGVKVKMYATHPGPRGRRRAERGNKAPQLIAVHAQRPLPTGLVSDGKLPAHCRTPFHAPTTGLPSGG